MRLLNVMERLLITKQDANAVISIAAKKEAWQLTAHESYCDDPRLPEDLRDKNGLLLETADGFSIAGRILPDDVAVGSNPYPQFVLASVLGYVTVFLPLFMMCVGATMFGIWGTHITWHHITGAAAIGVGIAVVLDMVSPPAEDGATVTMAASLGFGFLVGLLAMEVVLGGESMIASLVSNAMGGARKEATPVPGATLAWFLYLMCAAATIYYGQWLCVMSLAVGAIAVALVTFSGLNQIEVAVMAGVTMAVYPYFIDLRRRGERVEELAQHCRITPMPRFGQRARQKQNENALRQADSPFLCIGEALGTFRKERGDRLAPDAGRPMGLSLEDMSMHMMLFGSTGSGKTAGFFRPAISKFVSLVGKTCGVVVMDGKGVLPAELADSIPDMQLIDPGTAELALFQGLMPEDVVDALSNTSGSDSKKEAPIWKQSGEMLLLQTGLLLHAACRLDQNKFGWSLYNLYRAVNDEAYLKEVMDALKAEYDALHASEAIYEPENFTRNQLVQDATSYFLNTFWKEEERFRSNVKSTVNGWMNPLLQHRDLRKWVRNTSGFDITCVFRGGRIGFNLPEFKYKSAGPAITALCKLRLYRHAQQRGDGWKVAGETACAMWMDEAQEILTGAELQIAPIARSLGIMLVVSTQTYDQLVVKFSADTATALLGQFTSIMSFKSSPATYDYVQSRFGEIMASKRKKDEEFLPPDYTAHVNSTLHSPHYDRNNPHFAKRHKKIAVKAAGMITSVIKEAWDEEKVTSIQGKDIDKTPTVELYELQDVLAEPFVAVASFNRAGAPRRDFIRVEPIFV